MRSPCLKDCPKRSVTCHSDCEEYLIWVAEERAKKERIKAIKKQEVQFYDFKDDSLKRIYGKKKGQL